MAELKIPDREKLIADLQNPDKGYVLMKGYFSRDEADAYRRDCEQFLDGARTCYTRINTDRQPDYVHPRSHDRVARTYRIYQYLHNRHTPGTDAFFEKGFALRNALEETWHADPRYAAEQKRLQNYIIVTKYVADTGMLPRHRDYDGPAPFPLLQSLVLLSDAPDDYTGGDFILYTKSGRRLSLADDIGAKKGDLMLFDKSIDHSVDVTRAGTKTSIGRWSVLIGARAERDSRVSAGLKSLLYSPPLYPYSSPAIRVMESLKLID